MANGKDNTQSSYSMQWNRQWNPQVQKTNYLGDTLNNLNILLVYLHYRGKSSKEDDAKCIIRNHLLTIMIKF